MRHDAVRDDIYAEACKVGVNAEREKQGLLPPRPSDETLKGERLSNGRRPADVWLVRWEATGAAKVDFVVSSGMRSDRIAAAAANPSIVWGQYETFKRNHLNTEEECSRQGLAFLPVVIEAHGGGVGPVARRVVGNLAKARAAKEGEEVEASAADPLRRISISLQRENARAVLRRMPVTAAAPAVSRPEAWGEDRVWQ